MKKSNYTEARKAYRKAHMPMWEAASRKNRASPRRATNLISSARRRHAVCTLDIQDIKSRIATGKCEVTGIPFDLAPVASRRCNPRAPSLDRINPALGYTPENTRVVLWIFNAARQDFGDMALISFIRQWIKNRPIDFLYTVEGY